MRNSLILMILVLAGPALASNPGEPLGCSDFVFVEPGYSCTVFQSTDILSQGSVFRRWGNPVAVTNTGSMLTIRFILTEFRSNFFDQSHRMEVVMLDENGESVIATVESRSVPGQNCRDHIRNRDEAGEFPASSPGRIAFDPLTGRLLIPLLSYRGGTCTGSYEDGWWIASIDGFGPLLGIIQSYSPTAEGVTFRVPGLPEGLAAADHFDTFYGPLEKPLDLSQAQGLRCDYPTAIPQPGDYLAVADTVPDPAPGEGIYYVTAVTHQGATRYGRQRMGGVISGRDPSLLPDCVEAEADGLGEKEE